MAQMPQKTEKGGKLHRGLAGKLMIVRLNSWRISAQPWYLVKRAQSELHAGGLFGAVARLDV